jgi:hypothetical protein
MSLIILIWLHILYWNILTCRIFWAKIFLLAEYFHFATAATANRRAEAHGEVGRDATTATGKQQVQYPL